MSESLKLTEYFVGHHSDLAIDAIQQMPANTAGELIEAFEDSLSILTLKNMLPTAAIRCLQTVPQASAIRYLNRLNAKDAAAILRYASEPFRKTLLGELNRRHALSISILLRYPKTLVGAWMDTVAVSLQADTLISEARIQVIDGSYVYGDIYVVSSHNEVLGSVPLIELLQHENTEDAVSKIMKPISKPIVASLTLEQGVEWESWLEQDTLPVVDQDRKLVGIVRFVDLWGALVDTPTTEPDDESGADVFGIVEVYCIRLADLLTAMLTAKPSTS